MANVYKSKINVLFPISYVAIVAAAAWISLAIFRAGILDVLWWTIPGLAIAVALASWVMFGTAYRIGPRHLLINYGFRRWRIPLAGIHEVTPVRDVWLVLSIIFSRYEPFAVLSFDCVRVDYGDGQWIVVSPASQQRFVREIELLRTQIGSH